MRKQYRTTKECATLTGVKTRTIRELCSDGYVDSKKQGNSVLVNLDSLKSYIEKKEQKKIKVGVYGGIESNPQRKFWLIHGYDYMYASTSDGRIVDFSTGTELSSFWNKKKSGIQVWLIKNGKRKPHFIHQLVFESQGGVNKLGKKDLHHIDGNPANNKLDNLTPVWSEQHHRLHYLINHNQTEEYESMIKKIQKENNGAIEKLYPVAHPDWKSSETWTYLLWLNAKGYKHYKETGEIKTDCIHKETAELNSKSKGEKK